MLQLKKQSSFLSKQISSCFNTISPLDYLVENQLNMYIFFPVNFWCFICFYFRIAINIIIMIIVSINSWVFQIKKCFKLFASYIIFLIPDYALLTDFLQIMRCIPLLLDMSIKLWLYTRCCECYTVEWLDFVNVLKEHLFGAGGEGGSS